MTEEDNKSIMAVTPEDAASDICHSLEHLLGRELTACEKHTLSIKAKYWFMLGMQKQHLIITEEFKIIVGSVTGVR